jgi:hypothetical protein
MTTLKSMIARLRSALGWRRSAQKTDAGNPALLMRKGELTCAFREETWAFHFEIGDGVKGFGCMVSPQTALQFGHWLTKQAEHYIRGDA